MVGLMRLQRACLAAIAMQVDARAGRKLKRKAVALLEAGEAEDSSDADSDGEAAMHEV